MRAHATDTVRWQRFEQATFDRAIQQDKPILISSGYLSCYWCHRMKQDSFEDDDVGELINQTFIPVLLDRELEPEIDSYLQSFMLEQRGFGGWPATVILTPEAKPIAGFSYQTAAATLATIKQFKKYWSTNRAAVQASAVKKANQLKQTPSNSDSGTTLDTARLLKNYLTQTQRTADNEYGGFGQSEKFPLLPQLSTLLQLEKLDPNPALSEFLETSLQAMLGGALRDHIGGGFFRYSDTREWSAPHFEQMLYTQALVAPLLFDAAEQWNQPDLGAAATEVLQAMIAFFQREDGLFRSALSAVSEQGESGGYYLWTNQQLMSLLGKDFTKIYSQPIGTAGNVLPLITVNGNQRQRVRQTLLQTRNLRSLKSDDKALLGWNGLALVALARGQHLSPKIHRTGSRLFETLLPLTKTANWPRLIGVPEAGPAQLADKVYLLAGLQSWALVTRDKESLSEISTLISSIHHQHFLNGQWQAAKDKPLIGRLVSPALVDTELPSPTGLWLQVALNQLKVADTSASQPDITTLKTRIEQVLNTLPDTLEDNAFFHATTLSALIQHSRWQNRQQKGKQ